jgi:hypothetical protein
MINKIRLVGWICSGPNYRIVPDRNNKVTIQWRTSITHHVPNLIITLCITMHLAITQLQSKEIKIY